MAISKDTNDELFGQDEAVLAPAEAMRVLQGVYLVATGCTLAFSAIAAAGSDLRITLLSGSAACLFVILFVLARSGRTTVAGVLGLACVLFLVALGSITGHGIRDLSFPMLCFIMLLGNLVMIEKWARVSTFCCWLVAVGISLSEYTGLLVTDMSNRTTLTSVVMISAFYLTLGLTTHRLTAAFHSGLTRAHVKELSYRHIFNATSEAIFLIDPRTERIVDVNQSAQTMFGYSRQEFLRSSLQQLAGKHQSAQQVVDMMDTGMKGEPLLFEWKVARKDGSEQPVEVSLRPAVVGDQNVLLAVVRDASETRRVQAKLRESEKLQAVGQLAGGIAHDFNNQLTGILANASLLQERLDDPRLARCAEVIVRCSQRSSDLTSQLLAFARRGKHQNVNVDVHELISEVVELLKHTIDKRITLVTDFTDTELKVQGDPTLLQNALLNLGLNARDAMPQGGTLTFRTALHFVENTMTGHKASVRHGSYARVEVIDTGEGMNEATQKRIFEPFFTTKESGNGMGLAAVYGAVESHKGDISLFSDPDQGTTFTLLLPLSELALESVTLKIDSPYRQFPGKRILLADDEKDVAEATTLILEELGCKVTQCEDGQEAVVRFTKGPDDFDLVVLDHMMPRLSGREALIEMRKIRPHLRALLTSGFSNEAVIENSSNSEYFLPKPFDQKQLGASIARVLESGPKEVIAK